MLRHQSGCSGESSWFLGSSVSHQVRSFLSSMYRLRTASIFPELSQRCLPLLFSTLSLNGSSPSQLRALSAGRKRVSREPYSGHALLSGCRMRSSPSTLGSLESHRPGISASPRYIIATPTLHPSTIRSWIRSRCSSLNWTRSLLSSRNTEFSQSVTGWSRRALSAHLSTRCRLHLQPIPSRNGPK